MTFFLCLQDTSKLAEAAKVKWADFELTWCYEYMFQEISKNFAEGGASIKVFQVCFVDTLCCDVLRCFLLFVVASRRHIPFVFHFGASVVGGNRHRIMLQLLSAEKSQWTWQLSSFKDSEEPIGSIDFHNGFQTLIRNLLPKVDQQNCCLIIKCTWNLKTNMENLYTFFLGQKAYFQGLNSC